MTITSLAVFWQGAAVAELELSLPVDIGVSTLDKVVDNVEQSTDVVGVLLTTSLGASECFETTVSMLDVVAVVVTTEVDAEVPKVESAVLLVVMVGTEVLEDIEISVLSKAGDELLITVTV